MTADALALLFRRLVLAAQQAGALARPLEVAELLDTLIPYRAARRDGLLDTNDDYLHAVMQLLAGERGYVFADDLMQDDLKSELASPNPDLGVLKTYRTAKVRLSTTHAQEILAGDATIDLRPPTPAATDVVRPSPIPTAPRGVEPPVVAAAPVPAAAAIEAPVAAPVVAAAAEPTKAAPATRPAAEEPERQECPYCSQALPMDRVVTFCPRCGLNLRIRRCPGCSAEMEAEWKFCVTCGRGAP